MFVAVSYQHTSCFVRDVGLPWQLVIGPRGLDKGVVELKRRASGEREELSLESALARLTG